MEFSSDTMDESAAIAVQDLYKTYRDGLIFRKRFEALKSVSFQVPRGEIFGLLGPNGAGKTTFVKIMLGIVRKTSGSATMLGQPVGDRATRVRVGYLPEHLRLPSHLNALGALKLYGKLSGMDSREIREKGMPLLETVGLADRVRDSVKKYSKGMRQRLGLAQSLLHDPELLFLDEPTDGLDPVGRSEVRNIIHRLKDEGKTIFLNSHLLQEVEMVCDRFAILHQGELRSVGTLDQISSTTRDRSEVEIEILGTDTAIKAALETCEVVASEMLSENRVRIVAQMSGQKDIDACIDALRADGLSIVSLVHRRATLEDAFLKIIETETKVS
ncbi:MAG: ABC transporter ATP-binding protein [Pirellulaceae bacterium]|nr:ABC transporter ATP-binding protein [Pirellulaceae bacterium]